MSATPDKKGSHSHRWVQANRNELSAFPRRSDGPWARREIPDELTGVFLEGRDRGLIKIVGREDYEKEHGTQYNLYQLTHTLDAMIERYNDPNTTTLPCGHTGITNIPDGGYGCSAPHCNQEYDRQTAKEVLQS